MNNATTTATGEAMAADNVASIKGVCRAGRRARTSGSGGTVPLFGSETAAADDPLLALVRAFRAERCRFNASSDTTKDDFETDATLTRLRKRLIFHTPACRSHEGAREALRLIAEDAANSMGGFQAPVLASVLAFMRRRDAALAPFLQ